MEERNPELLIRQEGFKDIRDDPEGKLSFIGGSQICPTLSMLKIALIFASTIENSFRFRRRYATGMRACVRACVCVTKQSTPLAPLLVTEAKVRNFSGKNVPSLVPTTV
jgi:hypothetical protein